MTNRRAVLTGKLLLGLSTTLAGGWGALALLFAGPHGDILRGILAACVAIATLATLVAVSSDCWRWRAVAGFGLIFAGLLVWWSALEPSNARDWQPDVAVLPYGEVDGDVVTLHNIRNFDYRSETDYTPAYYDRRYDLRRLEGIDLVAVYWMGPAIAHVFLSFAFSDGEHLAVSIEARKEKGEGYSTVKGFFRQYELFYVVADERDVIRLRTNYRKDPPEEVYVYRLSGNPANARRLFVEYLRQINALRTTPAFYNALTTNCTTTIWLNAQVNQETVPFSWKILASGYVPEYLYEQGRLESRGLAFTELQRQAHVNARARAADAGADFSQRIRTRDGVI